MIGHRSVCAVAASVLLAAAGGASAGISASRVVSYTSGTPLMSWDGSATFDQATAALGIPSGDTGYGALTPFNCDFAPSDIVAVGAGGSLVLQLSAPVSATSGPKLGVFANACLYDVSADGSGLATTPATLAGDARQAIVSISSDGTTWKALSTDPIAFTNPANAYRDTTISYYNGTIGAQAADWYKPFTGSLADMSGKTYSQIKDLLNGSAGGTWLDVSSTGLSQFQYVKFDVPAGADYKLVLDAVTAVPEPASLGLLFVSASLLGRRRKA